MTQESITQQRSEAPGESATRSAIPFVVFTVIAGIVAAVAAFGSVLLSLEPWVMFAGWVAWFTRPTSTIQGVYAIICLWLGLVLAVLGTLSVETFSPVIGPVALPLTVFVLAIVAVGLRTTPVLNNMLAWFVGLVTLFAAEPEAVLPGLLALVAATAIGGLAGFVCQALQRRFAG